MKKLWKILSAVLTLAMLLSLAPMVLAEEQANEPVIPITAPTAERIYCEMGYDDYYTYGSILYPQLAYEYFDVTGEPDNHIKLSSLINEDGTFTEYTMQAINSSLDELLEYGEITKEELLAVIGEIPADIYSAFAAIDDFMYYTVAEMLALFAEMDPAASEIYEAFITDYPDGSALHAEIIEKYFDGNEKPALEDILYFLVGDMVRITYNVPNAYIQYLNTLDYSEYTFIGDVLAPNGAYAEGVSHLYGSRNVFTTLKGICEDGDLAYQVNEKAFTLITGYTTDLDGYLYTVTPIYEYMYDENGNKINDVSKLIDGEGKVIGTDMSVRDYAIQMCASGYTEDYYEYEVYPEVYEGQYITVFAEILEKYVPDMEDDYISELPDDPMAAATEEVDSFIDMCKEWGYTDEEILEELMFMYGDFEYDHYGYFVESVIEGYARDSDGNKIHIDDVMEGDGTLLTGEYKGRSVQSVLNELVETMDTSALLKGDVTADGKVNLSDVTAMLKKVAGWDVEVPEDAADANGDGGVNISDVSLTLQYIAGWDVTMVY